MVIIPGPKKQLAKRYYSNLIDYFFFFILIIIYIFIVGEPDEQGTYRVTGLKALVVPIIWMLYFPLCESMFGQTLGKRAFDLYVVDFTGDYPTFFHASLRRLLDIMEMCFLGIPALIAINASPKNQRLGDMLGDTTVITTAAICKACSTQLELTPKEVIKDVFKCPNCNTVN